MDAIAIVMMGAGVFLLYSAYKGVSPFATFQSVLNPKG